jgi:hypothetical protein
MHKCGNEFKITQFYLGIYSKLLNAYHLHGFGAVQRLKKGFDILADLPDPFM